MSHFLACPHNHLNVTLPPVSESSKRSLSNRLSHKNSLCQQRILCGTTSLISYPNTIYFFFFFFFFFFFDRHCNPCGLWPAQLSLSILSRKVFTECRCQRHVKPPTGGPVIRTFQLLPPGVPHVSNDASEPQQRKMELCAGNGRELCRTWRLPRHFWVLLHSINLRYGTDSFTSPLKEGAVDFFARKI